MVDARSITLSTESYGAFRFALRQTVIWTYLIAAEWGSHYLFGGSWVIDLMVIVMMVMAGILVGIRKTGWSVETTPTELKRWVNAGMPPDFASWRAGNDANPVN